MTVMEPLVARPVVRRRRPSRTAAAKRWLLVVHRWLGLVLWLVFCSWFASGMVLMYASYPEVTDAQRLALLPPLDLQHCCVGPDGALRAGGSSATLRRATIEMLAGRPVYRLEDARGGQALVYADDGTALGRVPLEISAQVAARAAGRGRAGASMSVLAEPDQWTLEVPRDQFPLARFVPHDSSDSYVYVSLVSGEIVQLATRRARVLAWVGAIPHWIYPRSLRRHRDGWRYLVLALSALGALGCLTGLTTGLWRARRRAWRLRSPFHDGWMRWHHYLGLVFGLFALTWVFSGLLSLDPFALSPRDATHDEVDALAGGAIDPRGVRLSPADAWTLSRPELTARRLELFQFGGALDYLATERPSRTRLIAADGRAPAPRERFTRNELVAAFGRVPRGAPITDIRELSTYDDYYYSRTADRPLPVVRFVVDDREATRYYLDVHSGSIVLESTRRSRVERWLYHGLHGLDFSALTRHPPAWDIVVIALSLGGLALSVSGAVVGLRWVRRSILPGIGTRESGIVGTRELNCRESGIDYHSPSPDSRLFRPSEPSGESKEQGRHGE